MKLHGVAVCVVVLVSMAAGGVSAATCASDVDCLRGKAFLAAPVPGASIRVVGDDGAELAAGLTSLDGGGIFSLAVAAPLPADFRVDVVDLATGETLSAPVRGYEPGWTVVFVSPVSTLVAAYLERHPATGLREATAAVNAYLGLPADTDLAYDLEAFDLEALRSAAAERGGLAAATPGLLDDLEAGRGLPLPELPAGGPRLLAAPGAAANAPPTFGSQLLDGFLGSLAASAAQKVAASLGAPGWMMSLLGGRDDDELKRRLDEVRNQLAEQKRLLGQISSQVADLGRDVEKALKELSAAEEVKAYQIGAALLIEAVAEIEAIQTGFRYVLDVGVSEPPDPTRVARLQSVARTKLWIRMTQLHDVLTGTPAVEGLIPLWLRTVGRDKPGFPNFVDHVVLDAAHRQIDLYGAHQLNALHLLIEAYHAQTPPNTRLAEKASDVVRSRLQQQVALAGGPGNLDDALIVDRRTSLLWHKGPACTTTFTKPRTFLGCEPIDFVTRLRTGGYDGWHLPTKAEIVALVKDKDRRADDWLNAQGFRVKAQGANSDFFLLGDGVQAGADPLTFVLWNSISNQFVTLKDAPQPVPIRVLPVRSVWPSPPRLAARGDLGSAAFQFIAKKIAAGAGSKVGGEAAGWIMRSLGYDTSDPVIGTVDQIKKELTAQTELMQRLSADVAAVAGRVAELKRQVLDLGDKTTYDQMARILQVRVSQVAAIHELLGWMTEADPRIDNRADVAVLQKLIEDEVLTTLLQMHAALLPRVDGEGLLPMWRRRTAFRMVPGWSEKSTDPERKNRPQFFRKAFLDAINDQYEYYFAIQVLGLQLLVEGDHAAKPPRPNEAVRAVKDFEARVAKQEEEVVGPRAPNDRFLYSDRTKVFWARAPLCPANRSGADCRYEWSPGATRFPRGDPATDLAAFAKQENLDCRWPTEDDFKKVAEFTTASTFRQVFDREGFDASFGFPVWLQGATADAPLRVNELNQADRDKSKAFLFSALPVCKWKEVAP